MAAEIISKRCCICKQIKTLSEFNKAHNRKDGHQTGCRTCQIISVRDYRQTEKGKANKKRYRQSEGGKAARRRYRQSEGGKAVLRKAKKKYLKTEKGRAKDKSSRTRHPNQIKARQAVGDAVKSGKLPRPDSLRCLCGKTARHYHHHKGYAPEHWLDVVPVCTKCHGKLVRKSAS